MLVHPGTVPIRIKLRCSRRDILLSVYDHIRVDRSPSLLGELKGLLGAGCLECGGSARCPADHRPMAAT
ncbi:MAG: hypothetical protein ACRDTE_33690 [Pseudonocardiaceae bacterium]